MSLGFFALGALVWSATEHTLHERIGHGPRRKRPTGIVERLSPSRLLYAFNAEHLAHHADPRYFAPTSHKVAAAVVTVGVGLAALAPLVGARRALAASLGFSAAYACYEVLHRRIHTHPPRGAYGRFVRRHHLFHHHKSPRKNHGVTSPLWDLVRGTRDEATKLRVPRAAAPGWMTDRDGEMRDEHARDYELVGPPPPREAAPRSPLPT